MRISSYAKPTATDADKRDKGWFFVPQSKRNAKGGRSLIKARLTSGWLKNYVRGKWDAITISYDYIMKG